MVCLGFEPWAAGWKQRLNYGAMAAAPCLYFLFDRLFTILQTVPPSRLTDYNISSIFF